MSEGYYTAKIRCRNCGMGFKAYIERGTTVLDWHINKECNNCGCKTLERDLSDDDMVELPPVAEPKPGDIIFDKVRL